MTALAAAIAAAPRAHDPRRGDEAVALLSASGPAADLIRGAAGSSPYLADLVRREADWLSAALDLDPGESFAALTPKWAWAAASSPNTPSPISAISR